MNDSRYETNLLAQPKLIRAVLDRPAPKWLKPPVGRTIFLVGVGTNHHAAQLVTWLWSRAGLDARAVHSYDFVTRPYQVDSRDLAVFLSHRGSKSYTVAAERLARRAGAETVVITGKGCRWKTSHRLETGPMENTVAFTQSLTTTMAWLLRWPGKPALLAPFKAMEKSLRWGPSFPRPETETDLVLIGDGLREWIAREIALKLQETACLRARPFGLEEFLHGPRLSIGNGSVVVGFSSLREKRWDVARRYLEEIEVPFVEASSENWLAQIFWGQRFALDCCQHLGVNPDFPRAQTLRLKR